MTAVELAIVMTVLILILFGTIQFGIAYNRSQGLQAGAREGGRVASIGATHTEILNRVRTAQSLFEPTDVQVETTPATTGAQRPCQVAGIGNMVAVRAYVPDAEKYAIEIPLWGRRAVDYQATASFRCERTVP